MSATSAYISPCRHRRYWVIGGFCWCYECGAVRQIRDVAGTNQFEFAWPRWVKPVGKGGDNPWPDFKETTNA